MMDTPVDFFKDSKSLLEVNHPLAPYTSWRIGGPARRYFRPKNRQALCEWLPTLPKQEPLFWLGLGSNVLIRDGGFPGTVIHTLSGLGQVEVLQRQAHEVELRIEAGVPSAKIAKLCVREQAVGGEFFAGIPGTMGGALAMNAGAFGGETWEWVRAVEVVDREGCVRIRQPDEYQIGYRTVISPHPEEWFLAAHLRFPRGDALAAQEKIRALLKQRNQSQPIGTYNGGSVFRNPPGDFAARLIEASHMKGTRIGDAIVSIKHSNFIVNLGNARACEVEALMAHVTATVYQEHGVSLKPEVHLMGTSE